MNEYYEKFKELSTEELKKEVKKLLKLNWPDFYPEKSEEEKKVMQEESRKIIEAAEMIKNGDKVNPNDLFEELESCTKSFYVGEKRIEYLEYMFENLGTSKLSYDEWLKQQFMVKIFVVSIFGECKLDCLSSLNDKYITWLRLKKYKEKHEFYDWFCNIGKNEILEEKYIKWICGEYNEQNRKQLYNRYIKYKILKSLGFKKDKKELTFIDWLIELYGKEYHSYDKFVITK